MYDQPAYAGPRQGTGFMTLDDVVQRTAAMLITVLAAGAVAWVALPDRLFVPALVISAMGGLGLGLYMSFTMRVNAVTALIYSALEGVLLGAISHVFEQRWPGIVVQAVAGTAMVAAGMLFVYKIGAIRVTPKFTRVIVGATIGVFGLMIVNLIAYLFTPERAGPALRRPARDRLQPRLHRHRRVQPGARLRHDRAGHPQRGAPQKFAWYAAFGLTVTLIWLYIEILRLLGYARR